MRLSVLKRNLLGMYSVLGTVHLLYYLCSLVVGRIDKPASPRLVLVKGSEGKEAWEGNLPWLVAPPLEVCPGGPGKEKRDLLG